MTFIFRMVVRELLASWRRLVFFFLCVAVGVGSIATLRSVIQSVRLALTTEARTLIASDVLIETRRPWTETGRNLIRQNLKEVSQLDQTESIETATMIRQVDPDEIVTKLVELRGVQSGYPFYGEVMLRGGQQYSHDLLKEHGALVRPELLTQLEMQVGDEIVIGGGTFTIRGVIISEPGRQLGAFSLGPRVLIDLDDLERTGLVNFASRVEYQILLKVLDEEVQPLINRLSEDLSEELVRIRSYRSAEDRVSRRLLMAENYLSLVGFVVVILGGIGVWSVTRVFIQQRLKSIAILKCLGSTVRQIFTIYLVQITLLGLGGSLLGIGLAGTALKMIPASVSEQVVASMGLVEFSYGLTKSAVIQGIGVGMLVSILFSLVPLLEIRHIKPLILLRWSLNRKVTRVDWIKVFVIAMVAIALVVIASWQAASLEIGLYVFAGFVSVVAILHVAGIILLRGASFLSSSAWFPLRHAVNSLSRPGNQTRVILLTVGLGTFFIFGAQSVQRNLLGELSLEVREDSPDMFFIDIQRDQASSVRSLLMSQNSSHEPSFIPVMRARVTGVNGRELSLDSFGDVRKLGSLAREYTITFRDSLEKNERIIDGKFWNERRIGGAEVSIEESIRRRFGIQLGDEVRFDVLGRLVSARVTSVRDVDWDDSLSGGFMFVFRPDTFEEAPHTFIAFLKGPNSEIDRAKLQRSVISSFPNISVIDGLEILVAVRRVLDYAALAISVVGAIVLFSGALILIGAIAMTKFQRLYDVAVLKTLGATTKMITLLMAIEYGVLGALAGAIGSIGALALSWVLSRYLFDITWHVPLLEKFNGILLTALIVGLVGVLVSLDVLKKKPLLTLRAE